MILRASLINAQSTVALVKFFVTCVRIRRIIYEILCYPVIYWRALYIDLYTYVMNLWGVRHAINLGNLGGAYSRWVLIHSSLRYIVSEEEEEEENVNHGVQII